VSAISGRFGASGDVFSWIFDFGLDSIIPSGGFGYQPGKFVSGLAATAMSFLDKDDVKGNRVLQQVADHIVQLYGQTAKETLILTNCQALVLFLQRRGKACAAILRKNFQLQKRTLGMEHPLTKLAGTTLAIALLLDSILSHKKVGYEVDRINDWLLDTGRDDGTILMSFALIAGTLASMHDLEGISKPFFKWLYNTQKRKFGRFSMGALTTLALGNALNVRTAYRRTVKKIPTRDGTRSDPRVAFRYIWPATVQAFTTTVTRINNTHFFRDSLPHFLGNGMLWKPFVPTDLTAHIYGMFTLAYNKFVPSDIGSRVWTIATDETSTIAGAHSEAEDDANTIDFRDLDGRASQYLSNLGMSLIDLGLTQNSESMSDFGSLRADSRLEDLADEIVGEFVRDEDIDAARDDVDDLEKSCEFLDL